MDEIHMAGIEIESIKILESALKRLNSGFQEMEYYDPDQFDTNRLESVMLEVADRMKDNFPYFHPLYAGQMMKPPHPAARLAYMLSLYINPNNHALDGGRASSRMEKEAVVQIAGMFGWETFLGHLTGGGTMANLEALWVAGQLHPGKLNVASSQAHYTHDRLSKVLGLPFRTVPTDHSGKMDIMALRDLLTHEEIGTVVATIGTTATGATDPLPEILKLQEQYGFRIHADTAYGGYFTLANNLATGTREVYDRLTEVDSIVVDPHKHGLQPYGCGCVLFRNPAVGQLYKHDSPYTYFSSDELHLGEISLECSRPGASAVALWATQILMPLVKGGEFSNLLGKGRDAALELFRQLRADNRFITASPPELDIVIWAPKAASASEISRLSRQLFKEAGRNQLHLALAEMPCRFFDLEGEGIIKDRETITSLRSVLMKPEHREWLGRIWEILSKSTDTILRNNER
ncbi:MAG: aminotransferase class I/II-fold pyridoxal phosphate-dependent enzyme [Bacteroidia bacterium]|nr:aminotransferase class I/II-fold pyridoxal phosphate-dependent enzyme [Bacteroidia bacterium]